MATKIRSALIVLAFAAPASPVLRAADNVPGPSAGHVLLLENERTLEGDIEKEGELYRVRRSVGETWVAEEKTLFLCANLEEAYLFLRQRSNLRDPDERVRLARWCQQHNLRGQALAEVTAAVELAPKNQENQRLLRDMQRLAAQVKDSTVKPASPDLSETLQPPVDLAADSMTMFANKVQPILMNTCANCHSSGRGGSFKLNRSFDEGTVNRKATQHNLAAVLGQLNLINWQGSPFLIKAVSVHGETAQPPLKSRQTAAYRNLEEWVKKAIEDNPQLREHTGSSVNMPLNAEVVKVKADPDAAHGETAAAASLPVPRPIEPAVPSTSPPPQAPSLPADPFDPLIFNRQMHPDKK